VNEAAASSPEVRNCGNCACSDIVTKPLIMPPGLTKAEFDAMPARQIVCRLNPPFVVRTQKGRALMQGPTDEKLVCWQWKPPGTRPGDRGPPVSAEEALASRPVVG
jgi:hypothetical protein